MNTDATADTEEYY